MNPIIVPMAHKVMIEIVTELLRAPDFPEGGCWSRRNYTANQIVVREGEPADCLYVIETGCLRVSGRIELEGQRHIRPGFCDLGPGDLFGELSLFDDHPRSASVAVVTDSRLLKIEGEHLRAWMERHPQRGYRLLKMLFDIQIKRLRQANRRVGNLLAWGMKTHGLDTYL